MNILDAWLEVIGRDGWSEARLGTVAGFAGTTSVAVAEAVPDRWAALRSYGGRLDLAALAEAATDPASSVRERLFAMFMERFDAAQDQRAAAQALSSAARRDPGLAAFMLMTLGLSVARIADAAGVQTTGWFGAARVQALTMLYLQVSRTWLDDESADLAATMKALDSQLARAEGFANYFARRRDQTSTDNARVAEGHPDAPSVTAAEAPRSAVDPALG